MLLLLLLRRRRQTHPFTGCSGTATQRDRRTDYCAEPSNAPHWWPVLSSYYESGKPMPVRCSVGGSWGSRSTYGRPRCAGSWYCIVSPFGLRSGSERSVHLCGQPGHLSLPSDGHRLARTKHLWHSFGDLPLGCRAWVCTVKEVLNHLADSKLDLDRILCFVVKKNSFLVILLPHQLELLPLKSIDLFINFSFLSEMRVNQIT